MVSCCIISIFKKIEIEIRVESPTSILEGLDWYMCPTQKLPHSTLSEFFKNWIKFTILILSHGLGHMTPRSRPWHDT
jgi:hypothetical protein